MIKIEFTEEATDELRYQRFHHPHPRVQRKMEALLLKSDGLPHHQITRILGVSENTLRQYLREYEEGGIERLKTLLLFEEPLVVAGDFNVIPAPEEVYDPAAWMDDALFRPETRAQFQALINLGLTDAFRACHDEPNRYTFWDYQAGAWPKNRGLRIDHLLLSPQAADRLAACEIDPAPRGWEKPSDHVPVWLKLNL